ncbi:melatonin receptor type 1B-B-like [Diadema antillarum]|uniref:melatonin receptor type 1B-B-like n=1 Tax=Diadema antillarum TaxID=105358 RepID=UPI003A8B0309
MDLSTSLYPATHFLSPLSVQTTPADSFTDTSTPPWFATSPTVAMAMEDSGPPGANGTDVGSDEAERGVVQKVLIAAFITCMVWGNVGNILVMGAILIDRKLRNTVANIFIFNLAIADFCVTSFVDLSYILGNFHPQWFQGKSVLCNLAASVCIVSCTCSMWSICFISINRFVCITQSKYYGTIYTRRNTIIMTLFLWVLCFFIDLPNYVGLGAHIFDEKKMGCSFDRIHHYGYTVYFVAMGVVIPLCMVLFCYIKVYKFVKESEERIRSWDAQTRGANPANQLPQISKADRRLMVTVFIIFLVFLTCWTPYAVVVLTDVHNVYPKELYVGAVILAHLNSSLNSILYGISNRRYRHGYKKLLFLDRVRCCRTTVGIGESQAVEGSTAAATKS